LYLPQEWAADPERRRQAGVPAAVEFATQPQLAQRMVARALAAAVPAAWVTGDEVDGDNRPLREWLESRGQPYVLAVSCDERVGVDGGAGREEVAAVAARLAPPEWERLSAGNGAKGPRLYDWALIPLREPAPAGWERFLLVRRSLSDPTELAYYRGYGPAGTPRAEAVRSTRVQLRTTSARGDQWSFTALRFVQDDGCWMGRCAPDFRYMLLENWLD